MNFSNRGKFEKRFYYFYGINNNIFLQNEPQKEVPQRNDSIIKNLEFTGIDNQKQTFKLKAKKGSIKDNNLVQLQGIRLYLFREGAVFYSIFSTNGLYLKSENIIKLNNNSAYSSSGKIKFISRNLQFDEKTKAIKAKNVSISHYKNTINGELLHIDENRKIFNLQKVTASLKY